jgi:DNA-binding transcriptional MerR regulator
VSAQQPRWTIAELGRKVADALATAGYEGPANGQVRAVPNERSIRYYTTLGLLDRPVEIRGRTALYGPRHLMQLVAIKRLQARGHSLAEVQAMLAGASHRKLVRIADVPRAVWAEDEGGDVEGRDTSSDASTGAAPAAAAPPARARFWDDVPAQAGEPAQVSDTPSDSAPLAAGAPVLLASLALAPGVTLLFEPERSPDAADGEALRRAAAQLLDELEARGLVIAPAHDPSHAPVSRAAHARQAPVTVTVTNRAKEK